jgi:Protein of unknown function (DUF3592)
MYERFVKRLQRQEIELWDVERGLRLRHSRPCILAPMLIWNLVRISRLAAGRGQETKVASSVQALTVWMTNNKGKVLHYTFVAQILTGLFLLWLGYAIGKDHLNLVRHGVRASGIVVDYKAENFRESTGYRSTGYMPIVQFQAGDRVVRFQDWLGSSIAGPSRRPVMVLYEPANPSIAMIDRGTMNWIPWAPTMAVGLFLLLVGLRGVSRPVPLT